MEVRIGATIKRKSTGVRYKILKDNLLMPLVESEYEWFSKSTDGTIPVTVEVLTGFVYDTPIRYKKEV